MNSLLGLQLKYVELSAYLTTCFGFKRLYVSRTDSWLDWRLQVVETLVKQDRDTANKQKT